MSGHSYAIGIDIGGTKTTVAAVADSGKVLARSSSPTLSERGFEPCLRELKACLHQLIEKEAASSLSGIGIGCAGPVSPERGTIHNPYTLPGWDDADMVTPLRDEFRVPVRLENDADAAAFGEFYFGAGRGANPLVMVTLGTGIGGGVVVDGKIYRGVGGEHPEIGHLQTSESGPECYCGRQGCWESIASGTAIASAGKPFGFEDSRSVFTAARSNANAASILQRAVQATVSTAWTLAHTLLPERIVLGGGIGVEHFDLFAVAIRAGLERATQVPKAGVQIARAGLGADAGVIGAAGLMFQTHQHSTSL